MTKTKSLVLVLCLFLSAQVSFAALPDIGDNSFFACVETEDVFEPGMCYGDISWVADQKGVDREGKILGLRKAKKVLKRAKRYFKKQRKKARRQGDETAEAEYDAKIANIDQSRSDLGACFSDYYEACSDTSDDTDDDNSGDDDQSSGDGSSLLVQACDIVADPNSASALTRSKKFIVNGRVCSEAAAASSPVLRMMLQGSQYCTGSLVASNKVLTAAHCLEGIDCTQMTVESSDGSQVKNVTDCASHDGYGLGDEAQANDVAMLTIDSAYTGITPVEVNTLATSAGLDDDTVFAGYGRNEDDDSNLRATANTVSDLTTEVISTHYRRGDTDEEGTTCNGDSGGPLFVYQDGKWKTQGTLSDGSAADCALPGTNPKTDISNWANLTSPSNQSFINNNL